MIVKILRIGIIYIFIYWYLIYIVVGFFSFFYVFFNLFKDVLFVLSKGFFFVSCEKIF